MYCTNSADGQLSTRCMTAARAASLVAASSNSTESAERNCPCTERNKYTVPPRPPTMDVPSASSNTANSVSVGRERSVPQPS